MPADLKTLHVTAEGPILNIQLNRPDTGNSIDGQMLTELLEVLRAMEDDPAIRVMVLSGAGNDFCKGADRSEFSTLLEIDTSGSGLRALNDRAQRVCSTLSQLGVVTIARLHGAVLGAGLGLAIFCDLRVGADTCRFRMPEVGLGLPPAWGGALPRLAEEAGQAQVRELLLTAESFNAARAKQLSILHKVASVGDLDAAVARWVKPIVRRNPATMRITKSMLNARARAAELSVGGYLDAALSSAAMHAEPPTCSA
ncbi:enoyl-CoA hydratase/isomerase family protein [Streptomyces sp. AP-93]|uniref:enoyl-CoA hydratase/isomerase family protein n=1 Tax=Streptomyces sp. AP-93 TaxID=2929048 RepID=UPI001FB01D17|nr:enoyl-CoA hydratase/isomerase family protein [Streptomyces sp. AP-93]MCJ0875649.1 enoyl-CoA hydratase/isomerase family protein [Streptomyces sp. AP-93]